jgi:thiosulfate dehydrogenase (quinone) large subunit
MKTTQLDKALAHGLARLGLGMTIALHGFVRLPDLSGFAAGMQKQFAETFLPGSLVYATGYCIAIGEAIIGTLLVLGLWLRLALAAGSLLMILLLTGTCLLQNWSVAGLQLGYLAFYAAVLATAICDRFSIDGVLRSRAR